MKLVGIDIGKNKHSFAIMNKDDGEILVKPDFFNNDKDGFESLLSYLSNYPKESILIGMEDTGHYHFNLLKYLLHNGYSLALINPTKTDLQRKLDGSPTKTDKLDTLTICDILYQSKRKKIYRITKLDKFELYQQRQLTRRHHNLKEELNVLKNHLQKSIDSVFPEFNSLFNTKYSIPYINILKTFSSASKIASADIRSINKCFETNKKGRPISLTAEKLKETTKNSIGFSTYVDELEIKQLIAQIQLIDEQISEIDKK